MKATPEYRPVAFRDTTTGDVMIIRSTVDTRDTIDVEGRTLPLYDLDVSSHSHRAYVGGAIARPESGQIDKFRRKYSY
ncbi:MAG TPA: 50S ribosomal protein L31 [Gammaproteobacteria bacterium]|jgi:large subunit ribosomal protein L31